MEVSSAPPNPPTGGSGGATSKQALSSNATNKSISSPNSDGDKKINDDTVELNSNMKSKVSPSEKENSSGKEDLEKMETEDNEASNNGVDEICKERTLNGNGEGDICNESMEVDDKVRVFPFLKSISD